MAQPRYRLSRSIIYGYFPTGVKWLLIINTVIFVIEYLGGRTVQGLLSPLALVPDLVVYSFPFYVWQLFTYMFRSDHQHRDLRDRVPGWPDCTGPALAAGARSRSGGL